MFGVSNIDMILKIAHLLAAEKVSQMYPRIAKKTNLQIIDLQQQLEQKFVWNNNWQMLQQIVWNDHLGKLSKKLVKIQDLFLNRLPPMYI